MRTLLLLTAFIGLARAEDPAPAPAPAPSNVPAATDLDGTWYLTTSVDGAEIVDWGCKHPPDTIDFGDGVVVLGIGGETNGGAVKSTSVRGSALVLSTTMATCTSTKDITVSWADTAHQIAAINRCAGTPRAVRAVRSDKAGVRVMRQCCDPSGKLTKRVGANDPCPAGSDGMKPNPLRP